MVPGRSPLREARTQAADRAAPPTPSALCRRAAGVAPRPAAPSGWGLRDEQRLERGERRRRGAAPAWAARRSAWRAAEPGRGCREHTAGPALPRGAAHAFPSPGQLWRRTPAAAGSGGVGRGGGGREDGDDVLMFVDLHKGGGERFPKSKGRAREPNCGRVLHREGLGEIGPKEENGQIR